MRVWVLQTGEYLPYLHPNNRPMRAANVVHALADRGHDVTLWTADFSHHELRHLYGRNTVVRARPNVDIRLVHSPGYRRNVGPGRLYDHWVLANNLRRLLRGEEPPDVAIVGFPPVEAAAQMVDWLADHGIPTVIDVKDQWPETLLRVFPGRAEGLGRLILTPYYRLARRAIGRSDAVFSITDPFLQWALEFAGRRRGPGDLVMPLAAPDVPLVGGDDEHDAGRWWDERGVSDDGRPRLIFVGRLTPVLDFGPILQAAASCPEWQVVIGGSGPIKEGLERQARGLGNVVVAGWLDHSQSRVLHRRSTAVVIPYRDEPAFTLSVPNKVFDALAHGLPIVTCLSGHLTEVIQMHGVGVIYGDRVPLSDQLDYLAGHPQDVEAMSRRAGELHRERYSLEAVYRGLVEQLEEMTRGVQPSWASPPQANSKDTELERERYDRAALEAMEVLDLRAEASPDPIHIREPYDRFHLSIRDVVSPTSTVLELGAGTGDHSIVVSAQGGRTVALDISIESLRLARLRCGGALKPVCADMASLPIGARTIDVVISAGALSYADPVALDAEIRRVLKVGGSLLVVDSLNHNPIFRANRWIRYRRGMRTRSTLERMPDQSRIASLIRDFKHVEIRRYGSFVFAYPLLRRLWGAERAADLCVRLDHGFGQGRNAFKFVVVATDYAPMESSDRGGSATDLDNHLQVRNPVVGRP